MKVQLIKQIEFSYLLGVGELYLLVSKVSYDLYTKPNIKIVRVEYRTHKLKFFDLDSNYPINCIVVWRYKNNRNKLFETREHMIIDDLALMDFLSRI